VLTIFKSIKISIYSNNQSSSHFYFN